jgi:ligand-binding sensor domain-containing protein
MKYIHLYTLFLMLVFHTSCGQNQTEVKKNIINLETKGVITSHGPGSLVRKIVQDRKGNIWMASWEGIIRYDGKSFTNITSKVSSARFFSVLEDRKGNFWFATVGSGVYYYDGKSLQHFTTREGLGSNEVLCIYEDKKGNVWFASGGLSCYDGKSFRNFTTKEGLSNNDVNSIIEDKTGKLWIGTRGDACRYDGKTFTTLTNKDGKAFYDVWSIIEDKKGNILFGDHDGLWRYDGSTFTKLSKRRCLSIIEDKKGNIWISGFELLRYDGNSLSNKKPTETVMKSAGQNNAFFGLLEAKDGSIWFGSGGGVHRYDGKTFTDFKSKEGQQ